jgi:chromosome segregation ATPase
MTKFSKVLTVLATFLSIAFMGLAFVSWATALTDHRQRDTDLKARIQPQKDRLTQLEGEIARAENRLKDAQLAIAADLPAFKAREKLYQAQLDELAKTSGELSVQIAALSKKAREVGDEASLRREEGIQLANQLAELRAQKADAETEKQKLTDLLVQAQGVLDRVQRRNGNLKSDLPAGAYEEAAAEEAAAPAK